MFDSAGRLRRALLRLNHPGWTDNDLQRYLEWEAANEPGIRDHAKKLWRILKGAQQNGTKTT